LLSKYLYIHLVLGDIPRRLLNKISKRPHEIFASSDRDTNVIESIIGSCCVRFVTSQTKDILDIKSGEFITRYRYDMANDGISRDLIPLEPSDPFFGYPSSHNNLEKGSQDPSLPSMLTTLVSKEEAETLITPTRVNRKKILEFMSFFNEKSVVDRYSLFLDQKKGIHIDDSEHTSTRIDILTLFYRLWSASSGGVAQSRNGESDRMQKSGRDSTSPTNSIERTTILSRVSPLSLNPSTSSPPIVPPPPSSSSSSSFSSSFSPLPHTAISSSISTIDQNSFTTDIDPPPLPHLFSSQGDTHHNTHNHNHTETLSLCKPHCVSIDSNLSSSSTNTDSDTHTTSSPTHKAPWNDTNNNHDRYYSTRDSRKRPASDMLCGEQDYSHPPNPSCIRSTTSPHTLSLPSPHTRIVEGGEVGQSTLTRFNIASSSTQPTHPTLAYASDNTVRISAMNNNTPPLNTDLTATDIPSGSETDLPVMMLIHQPSPVLWTQIKSTCTDDDDSSPSYTERFLLPCYPSSPRLGDNYQANNLPISSLYPNLNNHSNLSYDHLQWSPRLAVSISDSEMQRYLRICLKLVNSSCLDHLLTNPSPSHHHQSDGYQNTLEMDVRLFLAEQSSTRRHTLMQAPGAASSERGRGGGASATAMGPHTDSTRPRSTWAGQPIINGLFVCLTTGLDEIFLSELNTR
jgi:hypothetical protein